MPTTPVTVIAGSNQPGAEGVRTPSMPRIPSTSPTPPRTAAHPHTPISWRRRGSGFCSRVDPEAVEVAFPGRPQWAGPDFGRAGEGTVTAPVAGRRSWVAVDEVY